MKIYIFLTFFWPRLYLHLWQQITRLSFLTYFKKEKIKRTLLLQHLFFFVLAYANPIRITERIVYLRLYCSSNYIASFILLLHYFLMIDLFCFYYHSHFSQNIWRNAHDLRMQIASHVPIDITHSRTLAWIIP